jgi:hypothetical protein
VSLHLSFERDPVGFPQISDYVRLMESIISATPSLITLHIYDREESLNTFADANSPAGEVFSSLFASQPQLRHLETSLDLFQQLAFAPPPPMSQLTELHITGAPNFEATIPPFLSLPALRKVVGTLHSNSRAFWLSFLSTVGGAIKKVDFGKEGEVFAESDC